MSLQESYKKYRQSPKGRARALVRRRRNQELVREAKNKPCSDCQRSFHYSLMDLDHRPDEVKKFGLGEQAGRASAKQVLEEIAKCDPVCCMCHRVRTWNREHSDDQISLCLGSA